MNCITYILNTVKCLHILLNGTQCTSSHICILELGEEYSPPSQYLLPVLENDCGNQNSDTVDGLDLAWQVGLPI